jgi:hypothetical protein
MCVEFNYPMSKEDLKGLFQNHFEEHDAKTKWPETAPERAGLATSERGGRTGCVRMPTNIKKAATR